MTKELRQVTRPEVDSTDLGTPQFEDEETLLSARPVVPLDVVKAETKRWRLLFAIAVLVAMLAGAASAAFVYSRRSVGNVRETTVSRSDKPSTDDALTRNDVEATEESANNAGEITEIPQPEGAATSFT